MASARHRNKNAAPESNSQAAASNDVAKKTPKASKGSSSSSSSRRPGVLSKLLSLLFYAVVMAVAAGTGWLVYNLLQEVSVMSSKLSHLSDQKGELAETVYTLQKQVDLLEKTVGRVEFISKDIQEKQQRHDTSIKNCEKELDVVGVILKKLQKDLSTVIQDVKDQGDRDLDLFDQTMREKFTELNNSINEDLAELTEVQKSSQEEINNVKAKMASLGDLNAITNDLKALKELTSELKSSFKSKEESIDWLMNNALSVESVTANSNQIEILKNEQDNLKRDVEENKVAVENMREKILTNEDSSLKGELERVLKEFEQIASSVKEMEGNYISVNNDLLKEIEKNRDSVELRLKPLESIMNDEAPSLGSLKDSLEEYSRRMNAVEEAITGLKLLSSSDGQGSPEVSTLKEAQQALSQEVDELRSSMTTRPNSASDFEKLQVEVTSALEGHKLQIDELKDDYEKLKSSVGSSEQASGIDGFSSSIKKLESDLQMMRGAVDSLVAYSVKTEMHENDLRSVKETIEDLKESTDKLLVKYEQIQESV